MPVVVPARLFRAGAGHGGPAVLSRQSPPPGIVAAAERDYRAMREELDALLPVVRALLAGHFSEVEAVTDVWLTLQMQEPRVALFLGAVAIVRLAKSEQLADRAAAPVWRSQRRAQGAGDGAAR